MQSWFLTILVAREEEVCSSDAQRHSLGIDAGFKVHVSGQVQVH